MKLLDLGEDLWVPYLIGALPSDVTSHCPGPRKHVKASETINDGRRVSSRKPDRLPKREYSHPVPNERSPLRCYGCGRQGVIKSRCPTCNPNSLQRTNVATNHINDYTTQTRSPRLPLVDITFCGIKGRVCVDTGSSPSITGERMYQAKGNRTLLGTDFLSSAGLVLDVKNTCWYYWDNPTHKYQFGEELDTPSIAEKMSSNTCQLREEGESLTSAQKEKLNLLLESFQNVFEPGGEATTILEHPTFPCNNDRVKPLNPLRKRGRLHKGPTDFWFLVGTQSEPKGEDVTNGFIYHLFIVMITRWRH
ncbi:uncharacterized protein TNIN_52031 [Trichonephila inaurata madagascariensis]|uniref:CCHC-type domain-containing protein n=1 Tax=Trichonephila inaurata madagascariensis TaxID=2747483 RepID=A0A8X6YFK1_9ARAC|nr:uncharacterized protein TNIN_52031 [Trichonephila inaurata madagascariensis]